MMFQAKYCPSRGHLFLLLHFSLSTISALLFETFILCLFIIHCFEIIHSKCLNYVNINQSGTCSDCLFAELPFYRTNSSNSSVELLQRQSEQQIQQSQLLHDFDPYHEMLDQNRNRTSIAHLNTQRLSSTFDEFHVMLNEYQFDIITMS